MSETPSEKLFVARDSDVALLNEHFTAAISGAGRTLHLEAPVGGGKRALVGEFVRGLQDFDGIIWRCALIEEEDGVRTLLRLYATLYAALGRDPMLKGRVEMLLNAQMPQHGKRTQQWYRAFIEGIKSGQEKDEKGGFKVKIPRDNPAIGLVEIVKGIAGKVPVIFEVQNLQACQSVAVHAVIEGLHNAASDLQMLTILGTTELSDENKAWMPAPMLDFLGRTESVHNVTLTPWGADEADAYLASKGWTGNGADLARIAEGRPGFIAELSDILHEGEKLDGDLSGESLTSLMPRDIDEAELDSDEEPEEGRRRATAADLDDIAYRASLLGRAFPQNLVADIGGYDRDSVGDLLDAADELFEEMQFSEAMGTYIYQFKKASWREAALATGKAGEHGAQVAVQTGTFLERFLVPRAYDFVVKTARIYAIGGQPARAAVLRSMALGGDQPQAWAMTHDLMKFYENVGWPDVMKRTVYMNLMDRMAGTGDPNQAENLYNEIMTWADTQDDRRLKGWLLFAGSRLDFRRQDFYRSRDRAKDALTLYRGLEDKLKIAEIQNHMAMIELSDGNPTAALELVDKALSESKIETKDGKPAVLPQVAANAEFIRGLVHKRNRKWKESAEHFRRANEIAGQTGQGPLALEAGLNFGEVLLVGQEPAKAADVLQRCVQIAGSMKNGVRQRAAMSLLAQSQGALKNFDAALTWSQRTLQATQQLKMERFVPIDTYNVGLFTLLKGSPTEALALFRQATAKANLKNDVNFAKELLFNMGMAAKQVGETGEARTSLNELLPYAKQARDARKFVIGSRELAAMVEKAQAVPLLEEALKAAEQANMKEERKSIRKALEAARA